MEETGRKEGDSCDYERRIELGYYYIRNEVRRGRVGEMGKREV